MSEIRTIAEQDMEMPDCPRGKCSVCHGNPLKHHWMIHCPQDEEEYQNEEMLILQCRHCDAKIVFFDSNDPNCPDI